MRRAATWHRHPLVSAIVWFNDRTRLPLLDIALRAFQAQSWPLKEAVVLNTSGVPTGFHAGDVREVYLHRGMTRAEAMNMLVDSARGEWVAEWPDDGWFHPGYLQHHLRDTRPDQVSVVVEQTVHLVNQDVTRCLRHWELALACYLRLGPFRYPTSGSTPEFIRQFPRQRVLVRSRELVVRFLHEPPSHPAPALTAKA